MISLQFALIPRLVLDQLPGHTWVALLQPRACNKARTRPRPQHVCLDCHLFREQREDKPKGRYRYRRVDVADATRSKPLTIESMKCPPCVMKGNDAEE